RGVRRFSLAELSRRLGVTVGASYWHFADRDELLAAVAVRALETFVEVLEERTPATDSLEQRLAVMAAGYVRFAAEQPALFSVVFGMGLDKKSSYPELRQAYEKVEGTLGANVAGVCLGDKEVAV